MIDSATFLGRWRTSWWCEHASDVHLGVFGSQNRQGRDHSLKSVVDAAAWQTNKSLSWLRSQRFVGGGCFEKPTKVMPGNFSATAAETMVQKSLTNQTLPRLWNPVEKKFIGENLGWDRFYHQRSKRMSLRETHFSYQIFFENHHKQKLKREWTKFSGWYPASRRNKLVYLAANPNTTKRRGFDVWRDSEASGHEWQTFCSSQWHLHDPVLCCLFQSLPAFAPFLSLPVACCLCLSLPDFVVLPSCFLFLAVLCCFFLSLPVSSRLHSNLICPFQSLTNFRQFWRHSLPIPVPSCCLCWCFAQSTVFSGVFLCPFPF